MELKTPILALTGIIISVILFALFIFFQVKKNEYKKGVKIANTDLLFEDAYYKRIFITYYVLRFVLIIALLVSIVASFVVLSKPYYVKKIQQEKYNRDIMICLDISSSVNDLNLKLVKELQDTVKNLSGERVGIVAFNTSPVLLAPLSDDYNYTLEQLENIHTAIKVTTKGRMVSAREWLRWDNFLYGGTLIGNELRGSSLIGDGLTSGLINFPPDSKDRTKIIIFATDNDKNGDGYLSLMEAAEYCKKKDVTVYGIGTELMYAKDKEEMKQAMELTGGKFFLEEDSKTFHKITEEIESKSASLVKGKVIMKEVETPEKAFLVLCISAFIFILATILLKRINVFTVLSQVAIIALLVLTFIYGIRPAHLYTYGPDMEIKKSSKYNVIIAVDNTISMLADDGQNGKTRLDQAKGDINDLIDRLEGTNISVVSFSNEAIQMCPFNNNTQYVKSVVNSLQAIDSMYAKGSSYGTAAEAIGNIIDDAKSTKDSKVALFYISDGEITNEEAAAVSYSTINGKLDGGAVLGYGTKAGGKMYVKKSWEEEPTVIMDYSSYPWEEAVSHKDEENLNKIADDMGISYVDMNPKTGLEKVVNSIKSNMDIKEEIEENETGEEYINSPENRGYYFLIPVIILFMLNAVYVVVKK
ncbi:MAG: VWA domain-containing protein [Lachnospiraceae bacterium]|nr:VWA domain-containing protein [Lachnospiraceae bacterium]